MPDRVTALRIGLAVEGESDQRFFAALLPRLVSGVAAEISLETVSIGQQDPECIAAAVCEAFEARAIDLVCVHRDADSTNAAPLRQRFVHDACGAMASGCGMAASRCVPFIPFREMETWALADAAALAVLFRCQLPRDSLSQLKHPESLLDPKRTLRDLAEAIQRRPRRIPFDLLGAAVDLACLERLAAYRVFRRHFEIAYRTVLAA